jgi:ABC-type sugar transport system ATPase subunit
MTELINRDVGRSRVAVEARGISKSFGGTVALQGADLTASYGQVFAVLGENGAGKSTLMKVLAGALRPDSGTVTIDGSSLRLGDPLSAEAAGIGAVFQELTVIPDLTVAQNIFLRREPRRGGLVNVRKLVEATERLFDELAVTGIPPSRPGAEADSRDRQGNRPQAFDCDPGRANIGIRGRTGRLAQRSGAGVARRGALRAAHNAPLC